MTDDRMFERDAQAWLEIGPSRAPARAVQKALQIIATTPQQRDLRILWRFPKLTMNKRFAVAAAVGLLVVGAGLLIVRPPQSQVGQPSPSPTVSPSPSPVPIGAIQDTWASVGTRFDPLGGEPRQVFEVMTVDGSGLRINGFQGDVASSASMSEGVLTLQMQSGTDVLTNQNWDCQTGDRATYGATLSADEQTLALTSGGDACATREGILSGTWTRWSCPVEDRFDGCVHVSEEPPGQHVATYFKPFGGGFSGQLAYTIPSGWAQFAFPPTWFSTNQGNCDHEPYDCATSIGFAALGDPTAPAITVASDLEPSLQVALRAGRDLTCPSPSPAQAQTAAEIADYFGSLPWLAVSSRAPLSVGGLDGVQLDVSLVAGFVDPCVSGTSSDGVVRYSNDIEVFTEPNGNGGSILLSSGPPSVRFARFVILDAGNGTVVISLRSDTQASLEALSATAMPIIQSFEFTR